MRVDGCRGLLWGDDDEIQSHFFDELRAEISTVARYGTVRYGRYSHRFPSYGLRLLTVPFFKADYGLRLLTVRFSDYGYGYGRSVS